LRLPAGSNPRASALAAEWRAAARNDAEVVSRAIAFLRQGGFEYTLEPPLLGQHTIDEFLFGTKAGFCEHFSSAFVFLMRARGPKCSFPAAAGCASIRRRRRCRAASRRGWRASFLSRTRCRS